MRENITPLENQHAEQALLAVMMQRQDCLHKCLDSLTDQDFNFKENKVIFSAVRKMIENKEEVNFISVEDFLQKTEQLPKAGGTEYLYSLVKDLTPNIVNIEPNINILKACATRRNLADAFSEGLNICMFPGDRNMPQMIEAAENVVYKVIRDNRPKTSKLVDLDSCILNLIDRVEKNEIEIGLKTDFKKLDIILEGLNTGELIIVAGRPSMGKTTFALNIIKNVVAQDKKVVFFSMEMPEKQITAKLCSSVSSIELSKFKNGTMSEHEKYKLGNSISKLNKRQLKINDEGGLTVSEIKSLARDTELSLGGLDLIVIDYLGLIAPSNKASNKTEQIGEISNALKRMAMELKVPVIALCQLNRGVEGRQDKRPTMADLRDSGEIEQDADKIMFVYRDFVYNENSSQEEADIIIGKNRNGIIGTVKLKFEGQYSRFSDFEYEADGNVYSIQYTPKNKREEG